MFRFLHSIFTTEARQPGAPDETLIQAATERVVDGTDPRLRAMGGYRKKMRAAVAHSVEYVVSLVDALPAAAEISRKSFVSDARLRALFVSADQLQETVSDCREIQDFLQRAALPDKIYCLLSLERSEKTVFGMALQGDVLRREVSQTVINFSDRRVVGVSGSEQDTRWELKKRAFDHLIQTALQRIVTARDSKQKLQQQRLLLQSKLKAMQAGNRGLEPLLKPAQAPPADLNAIEKQIADIEAELLALPADSTTLDGYLGIICATLNEPQTYLRLDRFTLALDSTGVKRTAATDTQATRLTLDEVVGEDDDQRRVILLGYVPRTDILAPRDFIQEASRFLSSG